MASAIDATKPTAGSATTQSVRDNFSAAESEISALQAATTNVDNTSDADKPVSTATQTALDLKAPILAQANPQAADVSIASGTHTCDYATAYMQQVTATGSFTLAFSNFPASDVGVFVVDAVNWGAVVVTLPVGTLFAGGGTQTFTTAGTDRLTFISDKDGVLEMSSRKDIKV